MSTQPPTFRSQPDVVAVVDLYLKYQSDLANRQHPDVTLEARAMYGIISSHGRDVRIDAIVHEDDRARLSEWKRYADVHPMNGNRPQELIEVIEDEITLIGPNPPRKLIVVSNDAAFGVLCSVASQNHTEVMVWSPDTRIPRTLNQYQTHQLSELLPALQKKVPTVVVRLDPENYLIGLKRDGIRPDAKSYIEAIREATRDLGDVKSILAAADWKALRDSMGQDFQHEFEANGVRTVYQIALPGKSSSDMALAASIQETLERDPDVDTLVIASGDADFCPMVDAIHARAKKAIIIARPSNLSSRLREAADQVINLDDYYNRSTPQKALSAATHRTETRNNSIPIEGRAVTLQVAGFLRNQRWTYVYLNRLPSDIKIEEVELALRLGLLQPRNPGEKDTVTLAPDNIATRQAESLSSWLPGRIHHALTKKGYPYVDTAFLHRGLSMDRQCQELGLGQIRGETATWLEAAARAGIVIKKTRPHPDNPQHKIDTWWLPGGAEGTRHQAPNQRLEPEATKSAGKGETISMSDTPSSMKPADNSVTRKPTDPQAAGEPDTTPKTQAEEPTSEPRAPVPTREERWPSESKAV